MERFGSHAAPDGGPDDAMAAGPAVRDAAAILARAAADDTAANEARKRYRTQRMATLEPDARIAPQLGSDELVLAVRHGAVLDARGSIPGSDAPFGVAGDLYLTSLRIVVVGRAILSFDLRTIEEIGVSGERLILILRDGSSVSVQTGQPRLLRVEIGTALAGARV
ncbi:MAG: hypothetical protein ACYDAN_08840 [Candidatus Limnocylindrales bacterium]